MFVRESIANAVRLLPPRMRQQQVSACGATVASSCLSVNLRCLLSGFNRRAGRWAHGSLVPVNGHRQIPQAAAVPACGCKPASMLRAFVMCTHLPCACSTAVHASCCVTGAPCSTHHTQPPSPPTHQPRLRRRRHAPHVAPAALRQLLRLVPRGHRPPRAQPQLHPRPLRLGPRVVGLGLQGRQERRQR